MALFQEKAQSHDDEDSSFVIELLNGKGKGTARSGRHGGYGKRGDLDTRDTERFMREMATASEPSEAGKETFPGWDDGGDYARAAEAAGVDVGGMLEAGVDAKQLLDFVSNYRKTEGDKLGLLDEQNLKFATSQVLRKGQNVNTEAANTATAVLGRRPLPRASGRGTASAWAFHAAEGGEDGVLCPPAVRQGTHMRNGTSRKREGRVTRDHAGSPARGEVRYSTADGPAAASAARVFDKDDGAETARLCEELLRWSSALEGAERQLEGKSAVPRERQTGGDGRRAQRTARVTTEDIVSEDSKQGTSGREDYDGEDYNGREGSTAPGNKEEGDLGGIHPSRGGARGGARRPPRRQGDLKTIDRRGGSNSPNGLTEAEWADGGEGPTSSPRRQRTKPRALAMGNGHAGPTPSYALPTKHFKAPGRDPRDVLATENAHRQRQSHRQLQLEEENCALKLRLEGQRRSIHELEHQANTLREEGRTREEDMSRLKRKLAATPSSVGGGKCSFCASTHHGRARAVGDARVTAVKKRLLAAEARTQALERWLADSRAKEQRNREIAVSLKHSYSHSQEKVAGLVTELDSTRKTLSETRRELAESRKNLKVQVKDTRKYRRQQGEGTREVEIARAGAADLTVQLRKALKGAENARREAALIQQEKTRAETKANELERENRLLQDRLNDGQLHSRVRERERWVLSELLSEPASPDHRPNNGPVEGIRRRSAERSTSREDGRQKPSTPSRHMLASDPSDDDEAWPRRRGSGRRRRLGEGALHSVLHSTSESQSPLRGGGLSTSPRTVSGVDGGSRGGDGVNVGDRLPRRGGHRVSRPEGGESWAEGTPGATTETDWGLSTKSVDGRDEGLGEAPVRGSSTRPTRSMPSNMGARYEKLQAMYRRVNRRDADVRGRAGVG